MFLRMDPQELMLWGIAFVVSITVHEASHALVASLLGDPLARRMGRLSLNPLRHLDPIGTIMLVFAGFGWGKPVPVNPYALRPGPIPGMAMVAFAGPLSNLVTATLLSIPLRSRAVPIDFLVQLFMVAVIVNLILAVFNLIPIPPLDGFRVMLGLLPKEAAYSVARLEAQGPFLLLGLFALSYFGVPVFSWIMQPVFRVLIPLFIPGMRF